MGFTELVTFNCMSYSLKIVCFSNLSLDRNFYLSLLALIYLMLNELFLLNNVSLVAISFVVSLTIVITWRSEQIINCYQNYTLAL